MELGSVTITRDEIMAFARRWDPQPFHLSDEAAAASPLKKLSASGWHTLAILAGMLEHHGHPFTGAAAVKWVKPFFPGNRHVAHLDHGIVRLEDETGELVCEVVL